MLKSTAERLVAKQSLGVKSEPSDLELIKRPRLTEV